MNNLLVMNNCSISAGREGYFLPLMCVNYEKLVFESKVDLEVGTKLKATF